MNYMIYDYKDIRIEPFGLYHLNNPVYISWLKDQTVVKYLGRPEYFKEVDIDELYKYYNNIILDKNIKFFAVFFIPENKFIGTAKISLSNSYNDEYDIADLGIMIGNRSFWGKGLSPMILSLLCIYSLNGLHARKLTAGAISENYAVIKAFQKLGFKIEGVLRKKIYLNGEYLDHILLGCLKEELIID
jgi:ribosomal-protein-alanine N-acetyltransferase